MRVAVFEAKNELPKLLRMAEKEEVIVTRRGKPVSVILPYEEYERLRRLKAYLGLVRISERLKDTDITATKIYKASRKQLEERPKL